MPECRDFGTPLKLYIKAEATMPDWCASWPSDKIILVLGIPRLIAGNLILTTFSQARIAGRHHQFFGFIRWNESLPDHCCIAVIVFGVC